MQFMANSLWFMDDLLRSLRLVPIRGTGKSRPSIASSSSVRDTAQTQYPCALFRFAFVCLSQYVSRCPSARIATYCTVHVPPRPKGQEATQWEPSTGPRRSSKGNHCARATFGAMTNLRKATCLRTESTKSNRAFERRKVRPTTLESAEI